MTAPAPPITPPRTITGMSAILLPMSDGDAIDWTGFDSHVRRTLDAGLTPAVNMDTGYANLICDEVRYEALDRTRGVAAGRDYVAGVYCPDGEGDPFDESRYLQQIETITSRDGTPILFQSFGLTSLVDDELIDAHRRLGDAAGRFLFFELGTMFAPFGRIYSDDVYRELMEIPQAIGAKHSSLRRGPEWDRLAMRDEVRPEFMVMTGNDLAIDMVAYGSDYLLGLSTFAPDAFAVRDRYWAAGDRRFWELNDLLQYLGCFAFRDPVPTYKHSAAMFLKLRGWIGCDDPFPGCPRRPDSDREVLAAILRDLERLIADG